MSDVSVVTEMIVFSGETSRGEGDEQPPASAALWAKGSKLPGAGNPVGARFKKPMKTTHGVEVTEKYLKEAQRLVLSQNKTLRLMYLNRGLWWSALLVLLGAVIFLASMHALGSSLGLFFGAAITIAALSQLLIPRSLAKARKRNPMKGSRVTVSMDETGVDSVTPVSNAHLQWAGVSAAIIYAGGVLLRMQTRTYLWLPDVALIQGSPGDVRGLLADHVKDRSSGKP